MHRLKGFKRNSPRGATEKAAHQDEALDGGESLSVAPRMIGQCGIPSNATVVVYDFYQRLLAIGTRDGRLKIVGGDGVEALFISSRGTRTKQVGLTAQGGVLRLADTGCLELWSLPEEMILSFVDEEEIECFELMHTTPFVVVGSKDGSLRMAQVVLGAGDNPEDFKLLPYRIDCDALAGSGSIVRVALQPGASTNRVLIGFSEGDVSLWSLYEKKLVMTGSSELNVNGAKLSDVQWLGNEGDKFVSGYDDGSIWLWTVPNEALPKYAPPSKPTNVTPLCRINYPSSSMAFASILSLKCGQAGSYGEGGKLHIVAHGVNQDGMKAVMSVELEKDKIDGIKGSSQQEFSAQACKTLPWFGNVESMCVIESISSNLELEISAIVTLAEFSTVHIYDIEQYMPFQVDTPFQRCTSLQCVYVDRTESRVHSTMYHRLVEKPEEIFRPPPVLASGGPWPITGGRATEIESTSDMPVEWGLMVSGHQDGVARVWDTGINSIRLLGSFPSENAPASVITCLCVSSNLFVLGYDNGEMRVFVSASEEKIAYEQLVINEELEIENSTHDGSPFACLIRSSTHRHPISALQCSVDLGLIACGDESGTISVIGLEGNMLFCGEVLPASISSVLLATREFVGGEVHRCVVVSSESCSVSLIDLDDPKTMPEVMTPKNIAYLLYAGLLDQQSNLIESNMSDSELFFPGMTRKTRGKESVVERDLEESTSEDEADALPCEEENSVVVSAQHLVQCSSGYLRIYPLHGIAKGERTTLKKVRTEAPFQAAHAVNRSNMNHEGSSMVTIDEGGTLSVWSIPSFEKYWSREISDVLGWKWSLGEDARITFSSDGQVVLLLHDEIVRISLPSDDRRNPVPSLCLHDKEVADALEAALAAIAISSQTDEEAMPTAKKQSKFGSFLSSATSMMTGQAILQPATRPSVQQLHTVFSKSIIPPSAAASSSKSRTYAKSDPVASAQKSPWSSYMGGSSRPESKPKEKPGRRTVDEIKAAYGRDTSKVKNIMAENMNKLAERGEKLSQIQDKTQQLENDAEDFMTMAKKLAEREKNRKWYEF
ncbi:WD40 repeat domain-containing protein [Chloropicon primus]|nr:WD40 repeat domain-containing protein [Chloropicon primus]